MCFKPIYSGNPNPYDISEYNIIQENDSDVTVKGKIDAQYKEYKKFKDHKPEQAAMPTK